MVGNNDGGEDGEALLGVQGNVKLVGVDPRNLDLVPRLASVTQVA